MAIASIFFVVLLITEKLPQPPKTISRDAKRNYSSARDSRSFIGVIQEADENITQVAIGTHESYQLLIEGLSSQNIKKLQEAQVKVSKLEENIQDLRNNLFFFIKNLEENSIDASRFYIDTLSYIQDIIEDINYLTQISYEHVNNNHSKLKLSQIR